MFGRFGLGELVIILLIVLVQVFQSVGTKLAVKTDKRLKNKE